MSSSYRKHEKGGREGIGETCIFRLIFHSAFSFSFSSVNDQSGRQCHTALSSVKSNPTGAYLLRKSAIWIYGGQREEEEEEEEGGRAKGVDDLLDIVRMH
jgi:hypothetical protein